MHKIENTLGQSQFKALCLKYNSLIAEAEANLQVYFENPVGIGEHSDMQPEYDRWVTQLTDATDKFDTLNKFFQI